VKRLTEHWKTRYDWRKTEAKLNELPNFKTSVHVDAFEPIDLHFLHQPSSDKAAIPLLFCHGWPGSYVEVVKIMRMLSDSSSGVSFHIVAPSLPNFAWSAGKLHSNSI